MLAWLSVIVLIAGLVTWLVASNNKVAMIGFGLFVAGCSVILSHIDRSERIAPPPAASHR